MSKKEPENEPKETQEKEPKKEAETKTETKVEPMPIMGAPKTVSEKSESLSGLDVERIVSETFDKKLSEFLKKGPENAPVETKTEPKSYRLFDEFDPGV